MSTILRFLFLFLSAALVTPTAAHAQVSHSLTVYGVGFQIDGTAAVGDLTADVDVDADEFIDTLDMGGIASYRLETPTWSFVVDGARSWGSGSRRTAARWRWT